MNINTPETQEYLMELYNQTQGDQEKQVSMADIGSALGMDKPQAGLIGEWLIVEGMVELRTLAGGVSITAQGVEVLQEAGLIRVSAKVSHRLSRAPVLDEKDCQVVGQILADLKRAFGSLSASYQDLEEIVIDMKTIEIQLLSPKPKATIVRAVLESLHASVKRLELNEVEGILSGVLE